MAESRTTEISRSLLEPYRIPDDCPYLSEAEKELSLLPVEERGRWWAEWLFMALATEKELGIDRDDDEEPGFCQK